ncbi:hypothetical protein ACIBJC_36130 [Streptomyces sp. NPDC050509]|uniref:hypothetical protein n=1 Tax=Streptomyces sp. NPDC050509 TaxID=3365620 RepID=UPI0037BC6933
MSEQHVSEPPTALSPLSAASPTAAHTTSTLERGSFCLARCTCGWSGPARRARDRARTDASDHATEHAPGVHAADAGNTLDATTALR